MGNIILYNTEDGRSRVQLRVDRNTVWLSQREMAVLFDVSVDNIGLHLKNIYLDGELDREATTEESSVVQIEGEREAREADKQDDDELKALESKIKGRKG